MSATIDREALRRLPENELIQLMLGALPTDEERFYIELEFVQNLSNPKYLNFLAKHKYLDDPAFIEFLKYLRYWKKPEYLRHILFPQCLQFLDNLIDNELFRRELIVPEFMDFIHQQQYMRWQQGSQMS
jgi:mediator of RNA polymerase II transcription subunit 31